MKIKLQCSPLASVIGSTSLAVVAYLLPVSDASAIAGLTYDLRATLVNNSALSGGNTSKSLQLNNGDVVTVQVWATVLGAPGVATEEGFANGYGKIVATHAGGVTGNLSDSSMTAGFSVGAFQLGAVQDLNGDGFTDIGSNALQSTSNVNPLLSGTSLFFARASGTATVLVPLGTTVNAVTDGAEFLLSTFKYTVAGAVVGSPTLINFFAPTFTSGSQREFLARADGAAKNDTNFPYGSGANISIVAAVPEPSAFGMVLVGALGLVGFRRLGFRRTA
jgi:hypothetical protein